MVEEQYSKNHDDPILTLFESYLNFIAPTNLPPDLATMKASHRLLEHLRIVDKRRRTKMVTLLSELLETTPCLDIYLEEVRYGRFSYNPTNLTGTGPYPDHEQYKLSPIEGGLYNLLLTNGGHVVANNRLLFAWDVYRSAGNTNQLKTHMSHIRDKIGDHHRNSFKYQGHIRAVATAGYGFYDDLD